MNVDPYAFQPHSKLPRQPRVVIVFRDLFLSDYNISAKCKGCFSIVPSWLVWSFTVCNIDGTDTLLLSQTISFVSHSTKYIGMWYLTLLEELVVAAHVVNYY